MATVEERMQILKMIEDGKISATEGSELLRALDREKEEIPAEPLKGASAPRWFRVRITDTKSGKNKVNVNIPIGLVNVGMKMGAKFTPEVEGFDFDVLMKAVKSGQQGKVMDLVDDDEGERVEIFVE
jgi:hypothetical protein